MTDPDTRICEPCKGTGKSGTYSQPAGQPYADYAPDSCLRCHGTGKVPTFTADIRALLDKADAAETHWETRHDPGHALDVRTSGMDAQESYREAYGLLLSRAEKARTEVDAYDAQQLAFLESAQLDTEEGDAARAWARAEIERSKGARS